MPLAVTNKIKSYYVSIDFMKLHYTNMNTKANKSIEAYIKYLLKNTVVC